MVLTNEMKKDRRNCGEDSDCNECSCQIGTDDCAYSHIPLYAYRRYKMTVDSHTFWVAKSCILRGCVGQGDTISEAIDTLCDNEKEWLCAAKKNGITIPKRWNE